MSSVSRSTRIAVLGAVLVTAACSKRQADESDHSRFRPPTEGHAVSLDDGGLRVDPHSKAITSTEAAESMYMCSECFKTVSQAHVHVIPWFNDSLDNYVTTFRCDDHWLSSLDETRAHFLANLEHSEDREKFVAFFERHQLSGLGAADAAALKRDGLAILDKIRNKQIILSP
jgi:hypothetical protein